MAIRIYLSALTLVFLFLAWFSHGVSLLEGTVVTCALGYLILDTRECLQLVKTELRNLQQLEEKLSVLLR
ncbi:MAG TPA: hypothetical protein VGJ37_10290 [Pyrinomonadaceae bacterium]